jgi:hypothetical protein
MFQNPIPASMFLHIWYTWIGERMWLTTIKLIATFFISRHHRHRKMRAINATLDKRSWAFRMLYPPHFFFLFLYISKEIFCASFGIRQQFVDSPVFSPHHRPGILQCWPSICDFVNLTPLIWSP